jgi:Rieske Fe-S protein
MNGRNKSRREFLGKALGLIAIAAASSETFFLNPKRLIARSGNETLGTFTVDLSQYKYGALLNVDGSVAISIPGAKPATSIILTRTSDTTFQAVNRSCTHQGFLVNPYDASSQRIVCPAHGSQFLADGTRESGPATRNLPNYTTHYDAVNSPNIVTIDIPTLGVNDPHLQISDPELYQNFPNPVKTITTIRFKLSNYSKVILTVTDVLGHTIAVLTDGELPAGEYSFDFDASIWNSGTYFYHLNAEGIVLTKQMVVAK